MKISEFKLWPCLQLSVSVLALNLLISCGGGTQSGAELSSFEQVINARLSEPLDRQQALQLAKAYEGFLNAPTLTRQEALQMHANLICASVARSEEAKKILSGKELVNVIAKTAEDKNKMRRALNAAGSFTSDELSSCK